MEGIKQSESVPGWIRPDFQKERGEIERVARDFLGEESTEEVVQKTIKILEGASVVELSDEVWKLLENTDSFHNVRPGHIEDAEGITEKVNQGLSLENKRDFQALLEGFKQGRGMQVPTILKNKEGKLHLVSGNTRLMISRALNIRPKVIIGEVIK